MRKFQIWGRDLYPARQAQTQLETSRGTTTVEGVHEFTGMVNFYNMFIPEAVKIVWYGAFSEKPKQLLWTNDIEIETAKQAQPAPRHQCHCHWAIGFFSTHLGPPPLIVNYWSCIPFAISIPFATTKISQLWSAGHQCHLSGISEYRLQRISNTERCGKNIPLPNTFSRSAISNIQNVVLDLDYEEMTKAQTEGASLSHNNMLSLHIEEVLVGNTGLTSLCHTSRDTPRPVVRRIWALTSIDPHHTHISGIKILMEISRVLNKTLCHVSVVQSRLLTQVCAPLENDPLITSRFYSINNNIVGPLPMSQVRPAWRWQIDSLAASGRYQWRTWRVQ